jgi:hypothetical protein
VGGFSQKYLAADLLARLRIASFSSTTCWAGCQLRLPDEETRSEAKAAVEAYAQRVPDRNQPVPPPQLNPAPPPRRRAAPLARHHFMYNGSLELEQLTAPQHTAVKT